MKKTSKQTDELWGKTGPYSQAQLITEVRILDDKVSRTFLIVSVNINPATIKYIRKNMNAFKGDRYVLYIASNAVYEGPEHGYLVYTFKEEYLDETVMERARLALNKTSDAIIRMHQFIMQSLNPHSRGSGKKFKKGCLLKIQKMH